jgi:hypothetical protein
MPEAIGRPAKSIGGGAEDQPLHQWRHDSAARNEIATDQDRNG